MAIYKLFFLHKQSKKKKGSRGGFIPSPSHNYVPVPLATLNNYKIKIFSQMFFKYIIIYMKLFIGGNIKKNNTTLFYSGTDSNKYENGVGFVVNEKVFHNIKTFIPIDD